MGHTLDVLGGCCIRGVVVGISTFESDPLCPGRRVKRVAELPLDMLPTSDPHDLVWLWVQGRGFFVPEMTSEKPGDGELKIQTHVRGRHLQGLVRRETSRGPLSSPNIVPTLLPLGHRFADRSKTRRIRMISVVRACY